MSHMEHTVTCSEPYHGSIKAVRRKLVCVGLIDVASKLRETLTWFLMRDKLFVEDCSTGDSSQQHCYSGY